MDVQENSNTRDASSEPVTFHVLSSGMWVGMVMLVVTLVGGAFMNYYALKIADGVGGVAGFAIAAVFLAATLSGPVIAIVLMRRSRREGEIVIDPVRGEIRMSRDHEIPFSQVRQVEVVQHEYTYVGANVEGGSFSADITGWGIDIGGGHLLLAENGLSHERVAEIAEALKVRVEAYRARTGQVAAPLPGPTKAFLERLAASLRHEGQTFQENWLATDGPMVELMREFKREPGERTMGRDGEFAQALRKAGFDLGDAPVPPAEDPR